VIENDLLVILIENGRKRKKERKENKEKTKETETPPTFIPGRGSAWYKCEVFVLGISLGTNAPPHLYQMLCTGFNTWYK
jgi:hypothetical protein